jgi:hypothetical protein
MPPKKTNKNTKKPIKGNTKKHIKGKTVVRKMHAADLSTGIALMNAEFSFELGKKATAERVNPKIVRGNPSQFYKKDLESNILIPMTYKSVYAQHGPELYPALNEYNRKSNGVGKYNRALGINGFQQGLLNIDQRTINTKKPIVFKVDGGPIIYTQTFAEELSSHPANMSRMMDAVISEPINANMIDKYMTAPIKIASPMKRQVARPPINQSQIGSPWLSTSRIL